MLQMAVPWVSTESLGGALDRKHSITPDEQVDTLHGSLCHQCMHVCINGFKVLLVASRQEKHYMNVVHLWFK